MNSIGDSDATGTISSRDTSGTYTYNDGFSGSDNTLVDYTFDSVSEQFLARSGGGTYVANTDYKSSSSGSYDAKHGLTGDWTLTSKDDSKADLNWTTAYSGGMQNDSGTGTLKGKSSEVSTRAASGSYSSGATSGSYSEDWKSNLNGNTDLNLKREKNGAWTSNGTASGSSSGNTDWSDKTNLVTTSALYDSTLTTTTDTNTGRHYEYNMSTSRKLRRNTWSAYEGSGTGKGSGWDYRTVTKDSSYSRDILLSGGFSTLGQSAFPNTLSYTVNGKIEGALSDKTDFKYDDKFSLGSSGWATATVGEGTRKIADNYTATEEGSTTQSGFRPRPLMTDWDLGHGDLTYTVFSSLDMRNTRQTKTEIVFDWTNSGSTVTEQTKTSNRFSSSYKGVLDAQVLSVSGNIGSGNGSVEASNYHEEYSSKSTQTLKVDAYRGTTSWKGGTAFFESYKATDESKTQWSTEQTGHWTSNSRVNTSVDGVYTTSKFDALGDSEYWAKSDSIEKSVTNWKRSFDGQSYGTDVNTLFESTDTTSTTSDHTDYDYTYTTKTWNSSGLISQYSEGWGYHPQTDTETSYLTETTETNDGFQPQFLMGSVLGLMTITPVTGWNPSTATKFVFSTPTLSVSGASSAASLQLPDLVMTTTDFAAYGTVADTRTTWQKLADGIVAGVGDYIDSQIQAVVWINSKLDAGWNWLGDATGVDRSGAVYDPPTGYLDGVGRIWIGYGVYAWDTVKGLATLTWNLSVHPIDTRMQFVNAAMHPRQAIHAIWSDFYNKAGTLEGQSIIALEISVAVLTAGESEVVAGAAEMAEIAKAAKTLDKAIDATEAARALEKVTDAAAAARKLSKAEDAAEAARTLAPRATAANSTRGWRVGDPVNNLTSKGNIPSWSAVRQRFWKNQAHQNASNYSASNLERMRRGLAPQRVNPYTGRLESMELHHTPPRRNGGLFDVRPVWPDEHALIDPFRNLGG